jgi:hypothetical protein
MQRSTELTWVVAECLIKIGYRNLHYTMFIQFQLTFTIIISHSMKLQLLLEHLVTQQINLLLRTRQQPYYNALLPATVESDVLGDIMQREGWNEMKSNSKE